MRFVTNLCYTLIAKKVEFYQKGENMIKRDTYLRKLISVKENGFPKVLTGIRRCGKSYLLFHLFKDYLLSTGVKKENIIEIAVDALDTLI